MKIHRQKYGMWVLGLCMATVFMIGISSVYAEEVEELQMFYHDTLQLIFYENSLDGELVVQYGDIDNLGLGWPEP
ncbi:MAG: hypothetical protein HQK77_18885, partial [Desulfobacterales bacterium]|nr:hypothetical protein [Desulfobacterales bacterium]